MQIYELTDSTELSQILELNRDEYWKDKSEWDMMNKFERWDTGRWWADIDLLRWHFKVLKMSEGGILVASSNGKIIAELDYCITEDVFEDKHIRRIHIIWLLVAKRHRREGLASKLLSHLKGLYDYPIWVEAEDERSEKLYRKKGKVIRTISNWVLQDIKPREIQISHYEQTTYSDIDRAIKDGGIHLLGRYYGSSFDITQLRLSEDVYELLWGNTRGPELLVIQQNDTTAFLIATQYPRLILQHPFSWDDVREILNFMTIRITEMGFQEVYLQIYDDEALENTLEEIGYRCATRDDPIFQLI